MATERIEGLPAADRSARQEMEPHLAIAEQCNRPVRSPGRSSAPHHAMRRRGKQAGQMGMERVGFHPRPAPQAATSHSWRKSGRRCDSRSRTEYRSSRPPPKTTYGAALQSNRSGHTRNSLYRDGQWLHGWLPLVAGMRGPAYNRLVLVAVEFLLLHTMLLNISEFCRLRKSRRMVFELTPNTNVAQTPPLCSPRPEASAALFGSAQHGARHLGLALEGHTGACRPNDGRGAAIYAVVGRRAGRRRAYERALEAGGGSGACRRRPARGDCGCLPRVGRAAVSITHPARSGAADGVLSCHQCAGGGRGRPARRAAHRRAAVPARPLHR